MRRNSWLQQLLRNLMLLLQLLILCALVFALARPFLEKDKTALTEGHSVLVIDISASMQTKMGSGTRFDQAKALAQNYLGGINTIITAGNNPTVLVREADYQTALNTLAGLQAQDITTNLADALSLASEIAGTQGKIAFISDFQDSNPSNALELLRASLEARGVQIHEESVFSPAKNVGIIDVQIDDESVKVFVRNFNAEPTSVTIVIGEQRKELQLPAYSSDVVAFTLPAGVIRVQLEPEDDFPLDNLATFTLPTEKTTRVLLITNSEETSHLEAALRAAPQVEVIRAIPPVVPELSADIIVFKDVQRELFLKGKMEETRQAIEDGSLFIIAMQQNLFSFDFLGMLPVTYVGEGPAEVVPTVNADHLFMKDITLGKLHKIYSLSLTRNVSVLARVESSPVITFEPLGKGGVLFYGVFDEQSDFILMPEYPLFWSNVIEEVQRKRSAPYLNTNTGRIIPFSEPTAVLLPDETTITTNSLILSKSGLYTWGDYQIAANLLDMRESDVVRDPSLKTEAAVLETSTGTSQTVKEEITFYFLIAAGILLLLELFYLKYRGDF